VNGRDDGKDANQLIARVDQLIKRQQEDSLRAVEEVPLLTEIVEQDPAAAAANAASAARDEALATDIERVLVVRLIPELNKQIAGLRSELEKQLRRSVREAVEHALAARKANPEKK
jgi:adenosylcobinamide amidohydrolase